jgi:hypothetical protein
MNGSGKGDLARSTNGCADEIQGTHSLVIVRIDLLHIVTISKQLSVNCQIVGSGRASLSSIFLTAQ